MDNDGNTVHDETAAIQDLNRSLSRTVEEQESKLREVNARLKKMSAEMEHELGMARDIQLGLLPDELPTMLNIETHALYVPAGHVGGDLYDIIITKKQQVAILIFDVSGHGIPAAFIAVFAKMLFSNFIEKYDSPARIFHEVNLELCKFVHTDHYLTAFLGILNPLRNRMLYSRAGHVRPVVFHNRTGEVIELSTRGCFIGHNALRDIAEYKEDTVELEPQDKMLFFTDGLTESQNPSDEMYGRPRLLEAVKKCGRLPVGEFLTAVADDRNTFARERPLMDDYTLLGVQVGDPELLFVESGFVIDDEPKLIILRTYEEVGPSTGLVLMEMDRNGFPDAVIKRMKLVVFEMLTNALEHGNKWDPRKKVICMYKAEPDRLRVSVRDEGDGFDYGTLPDPLAPENITRERGRGIFIMRKYCDTVGFNPRGNIIRIMKNQGSTGRP